MTLSEAELAAIAKCDERRREVMRTALEAVYAGAEMADADAVILALEDQDARVVVGR